MLRGKTARRVETLEGSIGTLAREFDRLRDRLGAVDRRLEGAESAILPEATRQELALHITRAKEAHARVDQLADAVDRMAADLKTMTLAIAEGIERVDRAERRIKATVANARRRMAESGFTDDTLEAEASDLRLVDGGGGEGSAVPAMPADVGDDQQSSSIPGVPLGLMRRYRGIS